MDSWSIHHVEMQLKSCSYDMQSPSEEKSYGWRHSNVEGTKRVTKQLLDMFWDYNDPLRCYDNCT